MPFDTDADAQLSVMKSNLAGCPQTQTAERTTLETLIDAQISGKVKLAHIDAAQGAIRGVARTSNLFFAGQPVPGEALVYSTQLEAKVINGYVRGISEIDPTLSVSEAETIASQLLLELSSDSDLVAAKAEYTGLALHWHGSPMWLAQEKDQAPLDQNNLGVLPARLGLKPEDVLPTRYVLMSLKVDGRYVPRFVDSGGYPYWRPGGATLPIEQCPAGHDGLNETVADQLVIDQLVNPLISYFRSA